MRNILEKLKRQQVRNSTLKAYYSVWKQFNGFLIKLDQIPKFWEDRALLFLAHLIEVKKFQSSSVKSYMSAIKRTLLDDGYPWCDNHIMVNSLTSACKICNDRIHTKLPIHCSLLEIILFELERMFNSQPYLEKLYKAMFALGYYGLMRIGELTMSPHVLRANNLHLAMNKEKMLIVLYTSKMYGEESYPQKIKITSNRSEKSGKYSHRHFCLFTVMRNFIKVRGAEYVTENEEFFIFRDRTPVKATQARSVLKAIIKSLNLNEKLYNTHSLRIGRTSDLIKYGYSIKEVQRMGRWRSSAVYKYIQN